MSPQADSRTDLASPEGTMPSTVPEEPPLLYPFYKANIHERRFAARVARAIPLGTIVLSILAVFVGVWKSELLLLTICAVLNVSMWLFVVCMATFGIMGTDKVQTVLELEAIREASDPKDDGSVRHVVVFPNYKEDEEMMKQTLESLHECVGSSSFLVVLAMEAREEGAKDKADRLQTSFASHFDESRGGGILATFHEADLKEVHLDGTDDDEVPGKASNLKWAVQKAYEHLKGRGVDPSSCVLTVADADVLFHPRYFSALGRDFRVMRDGPGDQHRWTMWQAPQLPFMNFWMAPAPSRVWGYISSIYEFGGVAALSSGGHHMTFSAYSTNLQLAHDAQMWDGDVIAEDHHAYIKSFFYSVWASAEAQQRAGKQSPSGFAGCRPALRVRPIMLPVKATAVASDEGWQQGYVDRWNQAVRHSQGVAELSYSLLAAWDMLCTLPLSMYNLHFCTQLFKALMRPFFMHIVAICQAISLGLLTVYWLIHKSSVPMCPDRIWMASSDGDTMLCGLAGAWALIWPTVIPSLMLAIANYRFLRTFFIEPAAGKETSIWHRADGGIPEMWGSKVFAMVPAMLFDVFILMGPLMVPYGLLAELIGCWNVLLKGNHFKYITAAKATAEKAPSYGTMSTNA